MSAFKRFATRSGQDASGPVSRFPSERDRARHSRRSFAAMVLILCLAALVLSLAAAARLMELGPFSTTQSSGVSRDVTFASARGGNLHATVTLPDNLADERTDNDTQTPVVVFCHDFSSDRNAGGLFQPLADQLAGQGIASIRVDFAGHGESEEPLTAYTLDSMAQDLDAAIQYMNSICPVSTVGLVGHGMGGRAAALHLGEDVTAAALWSPANGNGLDGLAFLDPSAEGREAMRQAAAETGSYLLPDQGLTISADFLNQMDVSHPADAIRGYTGGLLIAFTGADPDLLGQAAIDDTLQAAADRGLAFTNLTDQFAGADHDYQAADGSGSSTRLREELTRQTAEFFVTALQTGSDS